MPIPLAIGKDPDAGRDWGQGRRGWQRMRWLDGITDSMGMSMSNFGSWWWTGRPGVLQFMGSQRVGHDWVTELNWYLWPYMMAKSGWSFSTGCLILCKTIIIFILIFTSYLLSLLCFTYIISFYSTHLQDTYYYTHFADDKSDSKLNNLLMVNS